MTIIFLLKIFFQANFSSFSTKSRSVLFFTFDFPFTTFTICFYYEFHSQVQMPVYFNLGDIAVPNTLSRNADECTDRGCKWPKSGRYVYVPYFISETFSQEERDIIIRGLQGFNQSTCIRLIPWKPGHRDHIYIESKDGCWSYVGRQNGGQYLSLQKPGCVYNEVVQHEILHALGFNHEQVRSDRDNYVRILFDNIEPNYKFAFEKKQTNNLGTPYDFTSVMEYRNDAFSKNGKPTIVARCNPNLKFGNSKKMSANDIIRINKLYECSDK
uniref:Metalloendopeptidase n=1 Tax=Poecilia latipinna TaxID=48699 RepID=A0A3B3V902_9TELE